jgi:hypothetical protein
MSIANPTYPSFATSSARHFALAPRPVHSWTTITAGRLPVAPFS